MAHAAPPHAKGALNVPIAKPNNRTRINSGPDMGDTVVRFPGGSRGPSALRKSTGPQTIVEEDPEAALPACSLDETAFSHLPEHGISLFLARRTKTIHFVRHAEGVHNAVNHAAGNDMPVTFTTPGSERYIDAHLTPRGIQQCKEARTGILLEGINPQVVIVSPFTRALQTAHLMFAAKGIPFIVHDSARERWGLYTCDKRRTRTEIVDEMECLFEETGDTIDFDSFGFEDEEDIYWTETRESDESCVSRGVELLRFLASRPESDIAVVSHSSFLRHLFSAFGFNIHDKDRSQLHRTTGNAEVRSVTLAAHRGFYPDGSWHQLASGEEVFVPAHPSFRRGKWSTHPDMLAEMHGKLLNEDNIARVED